MLSSRYVTFYRSLVTSPKLSVRFLAHLFENDQRTVLGRTLNTLASLCKISDISLLSPNVVKAKLKYFAVPLEEECRAKLVQDLLQVSDQFSMYLPGFTTEEVNTMLKYACTTWIRGRYSLKCQELPLSPVLCPVPASYGRFFLWDIPVFLLHPLLSLNFVY